MIDRMHDLQLFLRDTGRYEGLLAPGEDPCDGFYGPKTRKAVLTALEDGPDTPLTMQDYRNAAARLVVRPSTILAFAEVEAMGAGFQNGKPKLLFEPHIFCRLTKARFSEAHPTISYSRWGTLPYPKGLEERYEQLIVAVGLDPWAAFCSASYGKFQIMGSNHEACGYDTPWAFAVAMAYDEPTQLKAFESFVRTSGLLPAMRACLWAEVAERYNGPAYAKNRYDVKLATAAHKWEQQA